MYIVKNIGENIGDCNLCSITQEKHSFGCSLVKRVPSRGLEQRESGMTVLYALIIIILISYIIIK